MYYRSVFMAKQTSCNKAMEKYIFLDFDGVLNTLKGKFDKKAIDSLRRLLERSDAKVITLPLGGCKAWSTCSNCGRRISCQARLQT